MGRFCVYNLILKKTSSLAKQPKLNSLCGKFVDFEHAKREQVEYETANQASRALKISVVFFIYSTCHRLQSKNFINAD